MVLIRQGMAVGCMLHPLGDVRGIRGFCFSLLTLGAFGGSRCLADMTRNEASHPSSFANEPCISVFQAPPTPTPPQELLFLICKMGTLDQDSMGSLKVQCWVLLVLVHLVYFPIPLLQNLLLFIIKNKQYVKMQWKTSKWDFSKYNVLPENSSIMPLPYWIRRTVRHPLPKTNVSMKEQYILLK